MGFVTAYVVSRYASSRRAFGKLHDETIGIHSVQKLFNIDTYANNFVLSCMNSYGKRRLLPQRMHM